LILIAALIFDLLITEREAENLLKKIETCRENEISILIAQVFARFDNTL